MSLKQAESVLPDYIKLRVDSYVEDTDPALVRVQFEDGTISQKDRKVDVMTRRRVSCDLTLSDYSKFRVWVSDTLAGGLKSFLFVPPFRGDVDLSAIALPYKYVGPNEDVKIGRIIGGRYEVKPLGHDHVEVSFTIEALGC